MTTTVHGVSSSHGATPTGGPDWNVTDTRGTADGPVNDRYVPNEGGDFSKITANGHHQDVVATFSYSEAGDHLELFVRDPRTDEWVSLFDNRSTQPGAEFNLGAFPPGEELEFMLVDHTTDREYSSNSGMAKISQNDDGTVRIAFEDRENGDRDFDDIVMTVDGLHCNDDGTVSTGGPGHCCGHGTGGDDHGGGDNTGGGSGDTGGDTGDSTVPVNVNEYILHDMFNQDLDFSEDNDHLTMEGGEMSQNRLRLGGGDDRFAMVNGLTAWGQSVDLGEGNDELTMDTSSTTYGGTYNMGAGNDTVDINGEVRGTKFSGGEGDDVFNLSGRFVGSHGGVPEIDLRGGTDVVNVEEGFTGQVHLILEEGSQDQLNLLGPGWEQVDDSTFRRTTGAPATVTFEFQPHTSPPGSETPTTPTTPTTPPDSDPVTVTPAPTTPANPAPSTPSVTVNAGAGDDDITLNNGWSDGALHAGRGNDMVTVEGILSGGYVRGNRGSDTMAVNGDVTGGVINGNRGDDTVTVNGDASGGYVRGGRGSDAVTIHGDVSGGTVNGNRGDDTVTVNGDASAGFVRGGRGDDAVTVNGDVSGGVVNGNRGDDAVTVNGDVSDGFVRGGRGDDVLDINGDVTGGRINGNRGDDIVNVNGDIHGGDIRGGRGDDVLNLNGDMHDGIVRGGRGDDVINVNGDMLGGEIRAGRGDDTVNLNSHVDGGRIYLGEGNDTTNIGPDFTGEVTIAGRGENTLNLEGDGWIQCDDNTFHRLDDNGEVIAKVHVEDHGGVQVSDAATGATVTPASADATTSDVSVSVGDATATSQPVAISIDDLASGTVQIDLSQYAPGLNVIIQFDRDDA